MFGKFSNFFNFIFRDKKNNPNNWIVFKQSKVNKIFQEKNFDLKKFKKLKKS